MFNQQRAGNPTKGTHVLLTTEYKIIVGKGRVYNVQTDKHYLFLLVAFISSRGVTIIHVRVNPIELWIAGFSD